MKRILTSSVFLFVAAWSTSCVTVGEVEGQLSTWIGVDADRMAVQWGAPYGAYEKKDKSRILSYSSSRVVTTGTEGFKRSESRTCRVHVTIGEDNKILAASWRGELEECAAMIEPYEDTDSNLP